MGTRICKFPDSRPCEIQNINESFEIQPIDWTRNSWYTIMVPPETLSLVFEVTDEVEPKLTDNIFIIEWLPGYIWRISKL